MKSNGIFKRLLPYILVFIFGALIFGSVLALEMNLHFNIYRFKEISQNSILRMISDACLISGIYLLGTALIGFIKYINVGAMLYSAFVSIRQLFTLGFIPKGCRRAYRKYKKAAKEGTGTGLMIYFVFGLILIILAVIFLFVC